MFYETPPQRRLFIMCIYGAQEGGFLESFVHKTGKSTNVRRWKNECSERSRRIKYAPEKKKQE